MDKNSGIYKLYCRILKDGWSVDVCKVVGNGCYYIEASPVDLVPRFHNDPLRVLLFPKGQGVEIDHPKKIR